MVTARDVLAMLRELRDLTEIEEGSPQSFKVRAYDNAIGGIESAPGDVTAMSRAELVKLKGVGKSIADKIVELVETGSVAKLEDLRSEYPAEFVELGKIPGLGPKTLKLIRRELGVENLEQLTQAIADRRVRDLPGLGATSEEKLARAIGRLGLHGKDRRTPIAEAMPIATQLVEELRALPAVDQVEFCGSLRRFSETIGDIDITVSSTDPAPVMDFVASHAQATEVVGHGETKTSIVIRRGLQVDVRVVEPDQFGAAILYFTGSKTHNIALRQRAIDRGLLLNEYGLHGADGSGLVASKTESEIYAALDLSFIPPPLRENSGEIEAAAHGELPGLIALSDIRGDLHAHTDRSGDGRSSLRQMVEAAVGRGYRYLGITDHGEDLAINGLSRGEMIALRDDIRALQDEYPEVTLLFGCELNIGPDGSLDYDHRFRAGFDWCVASVHSYFDLTADEQTARLVTAISDPSVNAIGHLTGRYIGRRPGIELHLDPVLEAMAIADVGLEVNGALDRLDAPADVIRRATAAGVRLVISTDAHHVSEFDRMVHGVRNAQRGWATTTDVANALSPEEFAAWAGQRKG